APTDLGGVPVVRYEVERRDVVLGTSAITNVGTSRNAQVAAPNGRTAQVRVRAVTSGGTGAWSAWSAVVLPPFATLPAFAARTYQDFAQRAPAAGESAALVAALNGGTAPGEAVGDLVDDGIGIDPVVRLYRAYFLRYPETEGPAFWEDQYRGGMSINQMSHLFSGTPEFRTLYGTLNNRQFVRQIYLNVLEREPEQKGWDFWTAELDSGRWKRGRVMTFYSESIENRIITRSRTLPVVVTWGVLRRVPTTAERDAGR